MTNRECRIELTMLLATCWILTEIYGCLDFTASFANTENLVCMNQGFKVLLNYKCLCGTMVKYLQI